MSILFLPKRGGITFHQRNLQILAVELFKNKFDQKQVRPKTLWPEEIFPPNGSKIITRNNTFFKVELAVFHYLHVTMAMLTSCFGIIKSSSVINEKTIFYFHFTLFPRVLYF